MRVSTPVVFIEKARATQIKQEGTEEIITITGEKKQGEEGKNMTNVGARKQNPTTNHTLRTAHRQPNAHTKQCGCLRGEGTAKSELS